MNRQTAFILVATSAMLAACNPPDANRTTKAPPGVDHPTAVTAPLTSPSAPPAPAMRDAPATHAGAPGTDASVAFAHEQSAQPAASPATKGAAPDAQARAVDAQEAAAKAPDTASADAAKAETKPDGLRVPGTGTETSANNPRHGTLTKAEESTQMPKGGQTNNYSSTTLEEDSGRGRKP